MNAGIVILGAGFGGLELSARLSSALADDVSATFDSAKRICTARRESLHGCSADIAIVDPPCEYLR